MAVDLFDAVDCADSFFPTLESRGLGVLCAPRPSFLIERRKAKPSARFRGFSPSSQSERDKPEEGRDGDQPATPCLIR